MELKGMSQKYSMDKLIMRLKTTSNHSVSCLKEVSN